MAGLGAPCSAKSCISAERSDALADSADNMFRHGLGRRDVPFRRTPHQAVFVQALIVEEAQDRTRAFFTKHEIIIIRTTLIAVPFDHKFMLGICLQPPSRM